MERIEAAGHLNDEPTPGKRSWLEKNTYKLYGYVVGDGGVSIVEPVFVDDEGRQYIQDVSENDVVLDLLELTDEFREEGRVAHLTIPLSLNTVTFPYGPAIHLVLAGSTIWWGPRYNASALFDNLAADATIDRSTLLEVALLAGTGGRDLDELVVQVASETIVGESDFTEIARRTRVLQHQIATRRLETWYRPDLWKARRQLTGGWEADAGRAVGHAPNSPARSILIDALTHINSGWHALATGHVRNIERSIRQLLYSISVLDGLEAAQDRQYGPPRFEVAAQFFTSRNARYCCLTLYAFCVVFRFIAMSRSWDGSNINIFAVISPERFTAFLHSEPKERLIRLFDVLANLPDQKTQVRPGLLGIGTIADVEQREEAGIALTFSNRRLVIPPTLIAPLDYLDPPPIPGERRFFSGTGEAMGAATVSCRGKDHVRAAFETFFPIMEHYPETEFITAASNSMLIIVTDKPLAGRLLKSSSINRHAVQISRLLQIRRLVVVGRDARSDDPQRDLIREFCRVVYGEVRVEFVAEERMVRIHIDASASSAAQGGFDERKIRTFASALQKLVIRCNLEFQMEIWLRKRSGESRLWSSVFDEEAASRETAVYFLGSAREVVRPGRSTAPTNSIIGRSEVPIGRVNDRDGELVVSLDLAGTARENGIGDGELVARLFHDLAA